MLTIEDYLNISEDHLDVVLEHILKAYHQAKQLNLDENLIDDLAFVNLALRRDKVKLKDALKQYYVKTKGDTNDQD